MSDNIIEMGNKEKEYFFRFIAIANILKVELVINEGNVFRGHVSNEGIGIISHKPDDIDYGYSSLALTRVKPLVNRINLLDEDDTNVKLKLRELELNEEFIVEELILQSKRTKIVNRCASFHAVTNVPKGFKDSVTHRFEIDSDSIALLTKSIQAMDTPEVTFTGDKKGVTANIKAIGNDRLTHRITNNFDICTDDANDTFNHRYLLKTLIPIFRFSKKGITMEITSKGILMIPFEYDGYEMKVYIFAEQENF